MEIILIYDKPLVKNIFLDIGKNQKKNYNKNSKNKLPR